MVSVEVFSWLFVYKEWDKLRKIPVLDKGFEESFREYLYRKMSFDRISNVRDTGLGLSLPTLSGVAHEIDVICAKNRDLFVFELKHYEISNITKEIVFTFFGKVMDYYIKNAQILSDYKITALLVTINRNVDDSIRRLCMAFGIKFIEPSLMTLGTLDYFVRDLYQKIPEVNSQTKFQAEELVEKVQVLRERYDYSFSDIFAYKEENILIESTLFADGLSEILDELKKCCDLFDRVRQTWKSEIN